jgi:FkbM family methyltransferase
MQLAYDLQRPIIHNASPYTLGDSLEVVTPPQQWAYAAEFPLNREALPHAGQLHVTLVIRVLEGTIGIGTALADGTGFYQEKHAAEGGSKTVELVTAPGEHAGSIILRNVSSAGCSRAQVELLAAVPIQADEAVGVNPESSEVVIDSSALEGFRPWSGMVPAGYWGDWTGILTRADVWAFSPEDRRHFDQEHAGPDVGIFGSDEHVLEWAPLAQAVSGSGQVFRMAALGAGWGRWLAAGGALARQIGKDYHLLGVEAEPQHFAWMQRHMAENGFDASRYTLLEAAAAARPGFVWFAVGNPQAWYGQSIRVDGEGQNVRRVHAVTIEGILVRCSPLDYLHMDIQGGELDFLSYCPELLDDQVQMVNVGTHSVEIEAGLRRLFRRLGWTNLYDIELGTNRRVRVKDLVKKVEFGDGVQVWLNPRRLPAGRDLQGAAERSR